MPAPKPRPLLSTVTIAAVATFVAVVWVLHSLQTAYDPATQLMSELALGPYGEAMLAAFLSLALAIAALGLSLPAGSGLTVRLVLAVSSLCFVAAGVFPLGAATELHVAAVALGFVAAGVSMYLLPSCTTPFRTRSWQAASRGFLVAMATAAALGHSVIPIGVAQRLAAAALLGWLVACAWRLGRP